VLILRMGEIVEGRAREGRAVRVKETRRVVRGMLAGVRARLGRRGGASGRRQERRGGSCGWMWVDVVVDGETSPADVVVGFGGVLFGYGEAIGSLRSV
jgi:hypothetical protein